MRKRSKILSKTYRQRLCELIEVAKGHKRAELVIKNVDLVNVLTEEIYTTDVAVHGGIIVGLGRYSGKREINCQGGGVLIPGLIDAHTHIEMSMVSLTEFARIVTKHGTTCVIADPHEICNVLGSKGLKLMLQESRIAPLRVYFLVPSCVPSSPLETSGGVINANEIKNLLKLNGVLGLAEVMNYPGVINCEREILDKIIASREYIIDGHCPKLTGYDLNAYLTAGILSDHESSDLKEGIEKLRRGMRIMIREGSAARNLSSLKSIAGNRYTMLVTDGDRSVLDIITNGHLDYVYKRAIEEGIDEIKALQMLTINPADYFGINAGLIAPGRYADLVLLDDLKNFTVKLVLINGKIPKYRKFKYPKYALNTVKAPKIKPSDIEIRRKGKAKIIVVIDGEILTKTAVEYVTGIDVDRDILKAVVMERHKHTGRLSVGYIRGFNLKRGAIAQTISHDAHNIVAVGTNDEDICKAVNTVIDMQGGIVVCNRNEVHRLPLRIAGLMSNERAEKVAKRLAKIEKAIRDLGCTLTSPIVTLSFIALPVIPELKLTDLGLIDVKKFELTELFIKE